MWTKSYGHLLNLNQQFVIDTNRTADISEIYKSKIPLKEKRHVRRHTPLPF